MQTTPDDIFKALADPTRRTLFERLCRDGELTVRQLTDDSGVSQPAVSKHLNVLKASGLVAWQQEGRETRYRAQPQSLKPMIDWVNHYAVFWQDKFDKLETLLNRMDQ
jgi:DNA-binding transcriptional ArsR family regulator